MSSVNSRFSPPANEQVQDADGNLSNAWRAHFQDVANATAIPVGDYRQTALAKLGPDWLLCNGQIENDADYPALSAVIKPVIGPGAAAGTFVLPSIPPLQTVNGDTYLATWIKAF